MSAAIATDFFGEPSAAPAFPSLGWYRRIGKYTLLGAVVVFVNFPQFLYRLIDANAADAGRRAALKAPIQLVQAMLSALIGGQPSAFFERAMSCAFFLFLTFLLLLCVLCARQRDPRMLGYGIGGMVAGYFALHMIAWAVVAIVVAVGAAFFLLGWIGSAIAAIVAFVFHYLWPLLLVAALAGVAIACFRNLALLRRAVRWVADKLRRYWMHLATGAVALWLLTLALPAFYRWVVLPVWNFLRALLAPVVHAILFLLGWLMIILGVVLLVGLVLVVGVSGLALIGSLLVSQLQATWHAARSLRLMLVAGFAIGSMVALIALVSVATPALAGSLNQAWENAVGVLGMGDGSTRFVTDSFVAVMPGSVERFAFAHLTNEQAPAFDSLVFMVMMVFSSISLLSRIFARHSVPEQPVPLTFVAAEYGKMAGGLFVGLIMIAVAAATQSDSA